MCDTVNLKDVEVGSMVHFRCGGKATIASITPTFHPVQYFIGFKGHEKEEIMYEEDGSTPVMLVGVLQRSGLFDIVKVDLPVFNWYTAKYGMAFLNPKDQITAYFLAVNPKAHTYIFVTDNGHLYTRYPIDAESYQRQPSKDLKV